MRAPYEHQPRLLGEWLFPQVAQLAPEWRAAQVTGWLLGLDAPFVLDLLVDSELLSSQIAVALKALPPPQPPDRDDGEVWINSECTALMFGVEPDVIARVGDLTRLPQFLIKHGIRRRKEYEALVGSTL